MNESFRAGAVVVTGTVILGLVASNGGHWYCNNLNPTRRNMDSTTGKTQTSKSEKLVEQGFGGLASQIRQQLHFQEARGPPRGGQRMMAVIPDVDRRSLVGM